MIIETVSYCFHYFSCPKYIRDLGLLSELIAIESRYKRCSAAWQSHIDNTREALLAFSQSANKNSKIMILGAGLLNDIPLQELSEKFKEVILVDIFFLQSTINTTKRFNNVRFEEADLTGQLELAYKAYLMFRKDKDLTKFDDRLRNLASLKPVYGLDYIEVTHVASVNVLSQLTMPLKNLFEQVNIEAGDNFYQALIKNHIEYLLGFAKLGKNILLISDIEKEVLDLSGQLKLAESSIEGVELEDYGLNIQDSWDWQLAPQGELDYPYSLKLKVQVGVVA
jgi:hypothetical protein